MEDEGTEGPEDGGGEVFCSVLLARSHLHPNTFLQPQHDPPTHTPESVCVCLLLWYLCNCLLMIIHQPL